MFATELDPKFKSIFVSFVHVYAICIVILTDNDTRATTYRFYLAALQGSSMLMDLIINEYVPIFQVNCMLVFSESYLARHVDMVVAYTAGVFFFGEMLTSYFYCVFYRRCLVLLRGNRFCFFGWRRFWLFLLLQVYMLSMCAVFAVLLKSVRTPIQDTPPAFAWVRDTPSFILVRASTFLYVAAFYIIGWGFAVFIAVVWMIVDLQKELKHGMTHASRTTRRFQKRALTALKLQGIIPGIFYLLPMIGLLAIYFNSLVSGEEEAASNRAASTVSAILFSSLSIHTFAHSITILACSPTYRRNIVDAFRTGLRRIFRRQPEDPKQKTSQILFIPVIFVNQQNAQR